MQYYVLPFTFQYVSINTIWNEWFRDENLPLHSNMFLLIRNRDVVTGKQPATLHSNMFLLIRKTIF